MPFVNVIVGYRPERDGFAWECDCGGNGWVKGGIENAVTYWATQHVPPMREKTIEQVRAALDARTK